MNTGCSSSKLDLVKGLGPGWDITREHLLQYTLSSTVDEKQDINIIKYFIMKYQQGSFNRVHFVFPLHEPKQCIVWGGGGRQHLLNTILLSVLKLTGGLESWKDVRLRNSLQTITNLRS